MMSHAPLDTLVVMLGTNNIEGVRLDAMPISLHRALDAC